LNNFAQRGHEECVHEKRACVERGTFPTFIIFDSHTNYKNGLNIANEGCEFGLHVFWKKYEFSNSYFRHGSMIADVMIPKNEVVRSEDGLEKTKRMILSNVRPISNYRKIIENLISEDRSDTCNFLAMMEGGSEDFWLVAVPCSPMCIQDLFSKNIPSYICLEAVKQNGNALRYIKEQTLEICLEAVKQNGNALQFVKVQTPQICMKAVKQNGLVLEYSKIQTPQICFEAVKQTRSAQKYIFKKTFEINEKLYSLL